MTKKKDPPPKQGRYDRIIIARRIRLDRERQASEGIPDREPKQFAARIGIEKWSYYKKEAGEVKFTIEEVGRIAEELDAPPCYPMDDWDTLERHFPDWRPRKYPRRDGRWESIPKRPNGQGKS